MNNYYLKDSVEYAQREQMPHVMCFSCTPYCECQCVKAKDITSHIDAKNEDITVTKLH